jgi:hypothetical protein
MFSASTKAASGTPPAPIDPQFNYVTMLFQGDGTNGAQNNTFLDSSTNNFIITRTGTVSQGSYSPYGSSWSTYCDGSGQIRISTSSATLDFGTGNFTIEMWVNPATQTNSFPSIIACAAAWTSGAFYIRYGSQSYANKFGVYWNSVGDPFISSTNSFRTNAWYHIAVTRSGSTVTLWVNGVNEGSGTSSASLNLALGGGVWIGNNGSASCNYVGYVSNVRVVKGTAVYTSTFTPPTTPLTAISGTSLLTCQNSYVVDNSTNNFALTLVNDPLIQRFGPFAPTAAYSTSTIGGAGFFLGNTSDNLTTTMTGGLGNGDFTLEVWVYATRRYNYITWFSTTRDANGFSCGTDTNGALVWVNGVGGASRKWDGATTAGNVIRIYSWNHVAFVRSSGVMRVYLNGKPTVTTSSASSISDTANYSNTNLMIGNLTGGSEYCEGYLCDGRITTSALYTSAFSPPTAPLTAISNVRFLANFTNAGVVDNAMMNNAQTVGDAQISTSVVKYGTGSLKFDGTGDYLQNPSGYDSNSNLVFGTGDFTVEAWIYPLQIKLSAIIDSGSGVTANRFSLVLYGNGKIYVDSNANLLISNTTISANTWTFVTVCRNNGTMTMYFNGTSVGSVASTTNFAETSNRVGMTVDNLGFNGYIDNLRVTKGFARYSGNFTPPIAAFPNQ